MAAQGGGNAVLGGDDDEETILPVVNAPRLPSMIIVSPWQQDIDLMTKQGSSLWNEGTKPVDDKFTGQGKDVPRFIALVKNQVSKCYLTDIVTVNGKNLLVDYGTVSLDDIKRVRDARNAVNPTTLREAQPQIHAEILFHFIHGTVVLAHIPGEDRQTINFIPGPNRIYEILASSKCFHLFQFNFFPNPNLLSVIFI